MFECSCCTPARRFSAKKNLYRHRRKYDAENYVDPRQKEADDRRTAYYTSPKSCQQCEIVLSYEEVVSQYKDKFCSKSCAAVFNNSIGAIGRVRVEPKPCRGCGADIRNKQRQYCSVQCYATNKGIVYTPRIASNYNKQLPPCERCGTIVKHRHTQRYCSLSCQAATKRELLLKGWRDGQIEGGSEYGVKSWVRRYLHEKHGSKCWECGWDKVNPLSGKVPLQVDHIDGNPTNNVEDNLRLICPNCHSLTPTYMALNRGNGRHYRRKRYAEGKSF